MGVIWASEPRPLTQNPGTCILGCNMTLSCLVSNWSCHKVQNQCYYLKHLCNWVGLLEFYLYNSLCSFSAEKESTGINSFCIRLTLWYNQMNFVHFWIQSMDHEAFACQICVTYLFYSIYSLLPFSFMKTDKYSTMVHSWIPGTNLALPVLNNVGVIYKYITTVIYMEINYYCASHYMEK